jgi:hypothetical protein
MNKNRIALLSLSAVILLLSSIRVLAQKSENIIFAGLGIHEFTDYSSMGIYSKIGYGYDYLLGNNWSVMPVFSLAYKGCSEYTLPSSSSASSLYFEVPVRLYYTIPVAERTTIAFGAGPYAAIGIIGDVFDKNTYGSSDCKRFDLGITPAVEVHFNRYRLGIDADFGILNLNNRETSSKVHSRGFALTFGYSI